MPASPKCAGTDCISAVHGIHLFLRHVLRNVNPKTILAKAIFKIFLMKVNGVAFKFQPDKSNDSNPFVVVGLRVSYQLNQADVFHTVVRTALWVVARRLGIQRTPCKKE